MVAKYYVQKQDTQTLNFEDVTVLDGVSKDCFDTYEHALQYAKDIRIPGLRYRITARDSMGLRIVTTV